MNTNILKKCLDELAKGTPDISYVRGMIETLLELSEQDKPIQTVLTAQYEYQQGKKPYNLRAQEDTGEKSPAEIAAMSALGSIQDMPQPKQTAVIEKNVILN